jgi:hypothetical protein
MLLCLCCLFCTFCSGLCVRICFLSRPQHSTLSAGPRADPTPSRPCIKIPLTLLIAQPLTLAFHSHLPLDRLPPKAQTHPFVTLKTRRLLAGVPVAVYDPACLVELFQVDQTRRDAAGGQVRGGEGTRFWDGGQKARVREPVVELREGVWVEVGAVKGADVELVGAGWLVGVREGGAGGD